jgi:hypothetical protein
MASFCLGRERVSRYREDDDDGDEYHNDHRDPHDIGDKDEQCDKDDKDKRGSRHNHSRIAYFWDRLTPKHHYGEGHPMKPHRLALTHDLVDAYGLTTNGSLRLHGLRLCTDAELRSFHSADYVAFLNKITPDLADAWPPSSLGIHIRAMRS